MGFWTAVSRMAKGEPVFQPGDQPTSNQPPTAADAQTEPTADDTAHSVKQHPPELHIERIEHTIDSGDIRMQLWATFRNTSQWTVEIDKISMFGRTNDLYHQLSPGDADQLEAYDGPVLRSQPGGYAQASNSSSKIRTTTFAPNTKSATSKKATATSSRHALI